TMTQARTRRALMAVFAASVLVATACGQGGPSASQEPAASASAAASEKPQDGGRVIEATISDIATMQPILVNDTASGRVTGLLYDVLIQVDAQTGEPKPTLATLAAPQDGLHCTFHISAQAHWPERRPR